MDGIIGLAILLMGALALDAALGDPRWLPHPVRGVGLLAAWLERLTRKWIANEYAAGALSVFLNLVFWCGCCGLSVSWAGAHSTMLGIAVAAFWVYTTIAPKDLSDHVGRVACALEKDGLDAGRRAVGCLVGRDTENLDEPEVVRAGLESAGENLVDGVTSALFWAVVGWWVGGAAGATGAVGAAVGAMALRVVNTLDATYGYTTEQYLKFGRVAAKLDDAAHFLPARLTLLAMLAVAWLLGKRPAEVWRVTLRDHGRHASPNSGWGEAAMAGLLGVTLGGPACYNGEWEVRPQLGDGQEPLTTARLHEAIRAIRAATVVFAGGMWMLTALLMFLAHAGGRG